MRMTSGLTGTPQAESLPIGWRLRWPLWAIVLAAAWAAAVAAAWGVSAWTAQPVTTCLFKRVTGLPCPTCGSGRAALALLRGDVMGAWLYNPLTVTLGAAAAIVLATGSVTRKWPTFRLSKSQKRWLWVASALAVAANWTCLIIAGR
jgi:hypothetical protein